MAAAEEIATRKQRAVTNLKTKISKGITVIPTLIVKFKKEFDEQSPFVRHAATKVVDAFEDLESLLNETDTDFTQQNILSEQVLRMESTML